MALGTEASIQTFSLDGGPAGLEGPLILRLMLAPGPMHGLVVEHAVQNAVAEQGFPAPRVLASSPTALALGRPFMVMVRLPGKHRPYPPDAVELQMQTLAHLHRLDARPVRQTLETQGVPLSRYTGSARVEEAAAQVERWRLTRLHPLLHWLRRQAPPANASAACHGDPHLANMLFENGEVSGVLDWGTARLNHPEMDVGLVCGYARCRSNPPSATGDPRQQAVDRIISAYTRHSPVDDDRVRYFETEFLVSVLVDMTDRYIRRRAGEVIAANPLLDAPESVVLVQERLGAVTQFPVPSPEEAAG